MIISDSTQESLILKNTTKRISTQSCSIAWECDLRSVYNYSKTYLQLHSQHKQSTNSVEAYRLLYKIHSKPICEISTNFLAAMYLWIVSSFHCQWCARTQIHTHHINSYKSVHREISLFLQINKPIDGPIQVQLVGTTIPTGNWIKTGCLPWVDLCKRMIYAYDIVHRRMYASSSLNELMPLLGIDPIYRQNANVQVLVFELMPSNNWNIAGHNQPVVFFQWTIHS